MATALNTIEFMTAHEVAQEAPKAPRIHAEEHGAIARDNSFLGSLQLRLKNADWSKFEPGSDAFLDINMDLERLSNESPALAAEIWSESVPPGIKQPHFLAAKLQQREAEEASQMLKAGLQAQLDEEDKYSLPGSIRKRYLDAGDGKFHFREQKNQIAFEDRGRRFVTEHNSPDVAASMVELAEAKGWTKIKVAGHDEFKREVWLQASLKNIEVTGYKPKEVDLAKLEELKTAKNKNSIEAQHSQAGKEEKKMSPLIALQQSESLDDSLARVDHRTGVKEPDSGVYVGQLVEHGRAPYDFDSRENDSYFVRIRTETGSRILWGTDLERAMDEAGVKPGDRIEMERQGREATTVNVKQFDKDGTLIGTTPTPTDRIKWRVDPEGKQQAKKPELNDQQRVAVGVMAEVLKDKGYSSKTIDKAVQKATERLTTPGEATPKVQVYDKSANREVERPPVLTRQQRREAERTR